MEDQMTKEIGYGYGRMLDAPFEEAVHRATKSLGEQGFGVLCQIDIKKKLAEKLGVEFTEYVILGACNPALAYRALQQEPNLGLLLPCNVAVYAIDGKVFVAAVDATKMLSVVENPGLEETAREVNDRLRKVIDHL